MSPQNSYVENLISKMMVLGGGAFGRGLGHEGRVLRNGISALKRGLRELPCPFCHVRIQGEVCDLEKDPHSTRLAS